MLMLHINAEAVMNHRHASALKQCSYRYLSILISQRTRVPAADCPQEGPAPQHRARGGKPSVQPLAEDRTSACDWMRLLTETTTSTRLVGEWTEHQVCVGAVCRPFTNRTGFNIVV